MNLLNPLKDFAFNRELKKRLAEMYREGKFFNMATAKTIGILFNSSEESDYNKVSSFVRHLQSQGKTVRAIGWTGYQEIPHFCHAMLSYDFLTLKDINFYYKPTAKFAQEFIETQFDMLIDLNIKPVNTMTYMATLSIAKFKIGLYSDGNQIYDFMLEYPEAENLNGYLKELLFYLETLQGSSQSID